MFKNKRGFNYLFYGVLISMALTCSYAFAVDPASPTTKSAAQSAQTPCGPEITIYPGKETAMIAVIDKNGNVKFLNRNGEEVPQCQLCTRELEEKYDRHCEKATGIRICKSLIQANVKNLIQAGILVTSINPYCFTGTSGGGFYAEQCYSEEDLF